MTSPTVAVRRFEPPSTLMHCTLRAPELSATSRFVCIWIMAGTLSSSLVAGSGVGRHHFPALALGNRTAFADEHRIADLVHVRFVMRGITLRTADELLVDRVHDATLDRDDHGLVVLVADHGALQHSPGHISLLNLFPALRPWPSRSSWPRPS